VNPQFLTYATAIYMVAFVTVFTALWAKGDRFSAALLCVFFAIIAAMTPMQEVYRAWNFTICR
jgi:hypothetical protein